MITLDTHTAVWWTQDPDALSASATSALARAQQILIPAIVFWEVALPVRKGRLRLSGKQPPVRGRASFWRSHGFARFHSIMRSR